MSSNIQLTNQSKRTVTAQQPSCDENEITKRPPLEKTSNRVGERKANRSTGRGSVRKEGSTIEVGDRERD